MNEIPGDNRFELIEKYKQKLIDATNIESDEKEMAAIDNILFRFWQMGWLDKLEESDAGMTAAEYRERMIQAFHNADCDNLIAVVVLPTEKDFQYLEWLLKNEYVPFLKNANRALKSMQWIPCSERLPDALDSVLVTSTGGHVYISYIVHGEFEYGGEVIAWMPLPKPYEVEE